MRLKTILPVVAILVFAVAVMAQNRGTADATIKAKKISISYGKPSLQGRDMLGMARPGMVWRLGMNEATEIDSAATLVVGGKELAPGKYSLWARKTGDRQWTLAFHPTTGVWGAPELTSGFIAETPLTQQQASSNAEQLVIRLAEQNGNAAITIHWGATQLTGSFGVK